MKIKSEDKLRIMIYSAVALVVLVAAGVFYIFWSDTQKSTDLSGGATTTKQNYPGITIDASVIKSEAFMNLQEVKTVATTTVDSATSTPTSTAKLSNEKLDLIPRRGNNPFEPDIYK